MSDFRLPKFDFTLDSLKDDPKTIAFRKMFKDKMNEINELWKQGVKEVVLTNDGKEIAVFKNPYL